MNKILPKTLSRYLVIQAVYNLKLTSERDQIINNLHTLRFFDIY